MGFWESVQALLAVASFVAAGMGVDQLDKLKPLRKDGAFPSFVSDPITMLDSSRYEPEGRPHIRRIRLCFAGIGAAWVLILVVEWLA